MKKLLPLIATIIFLSSCSSLKSLNFNNNKKTTADQEVTTPSPKFIDKISVTAQPSVTGQQPTIKAAAVKKDAQQEKDIADQQDDEEAPASDRSIEIDNNLDLQHKYAILLNTDPDQLQNKALLKGIDEWYGTRYRMGGTTKAGIDCSAFVCAIFASVYGVTLPRMARDQYRRTKHISRTKLQEGDLLFFNTRGGVSHVGIYLQNNKFVHASTSRGVTVSDMFETYYLKRFVGAGRVENKQVPFATN